LSRNKQRTFLARKSGPDTEFIDLVEKRGLIENTDPSLLIADELGHIAMLEELREKMQSRMRAADEAVSSRDRVVSMLNQVQKPVVLTEGPTDKLILECAWKKLYNTEAPFVIKSCDVSLVGNGNASGVDQLARCIRSILPDSPHIVIGIFDRDTDGVKAWGLDQNFQIDNLFSDWKASKNGKAHGLLLPVPSYEPQFSTSNTLCIELLFSPEVLAKEVNGIKLTLEPLPIVTKVNGVDIEKKAGTEPWQMRIGNGKTHFAEKIVPTLLPEEFSEFTPLFDAIKKIIITHEA